VARGGYSGANYYTLGSASDLVFLHQTLVFTAVITFRLGAVGTDILETICDSVSFSSANKGFYLAYDNRVVAGSPARLAFQVSTASATQGLRLYSAAGAVADDAWHTMAVTDNNGSGILWYLDGAAITPASTVTGTTTTGNMTAALRVGVSTAGTLPLGGAVARFAAAPYVATADEMRALSLGYPLPRRMRSSTAVEAYFDQTPRDHLKAVAVTATGSPTIAGNPRLRFDGCRRLHQPQRGLARRMALDGLYVGSDR
jgi:hypothetical protein